MGGRPLSETVRRLCDTWTVSRHQRQKRRLPNALTCRSWYVASRSQPHELASSAIDAAAIFPSTSRVSASPPQPGWPMHLDQRVRLAAATVFRGSAASGPPQGEPELQASARVSPIRRLEADAGGTLGVAGLPGKAAACSLKGEETAYRRSTIAPWVSFEIGARRIARMRRPSS